MIGLDLDDLSVDGAISKAPGGGEGAGRNPVDRGQQGTKRSVATDGDGVRLQLVAAVANDHDSPLVEPTLAGTCAVIGRCHHRDNHGRQVWPTVLLDPGDDAVQARAGWSSAVVVSRRGADRQLAGHRRAGALSGAAGRSSARIRWRNGFGKLRSRSSAQYRGRIA